MQLPKGKECDQEKGKMTLGKHLYNVQMKEKLVQDMVGRKYKQECLKKYCNV